MIKEEDFMKRLTTILATILLSVLSFSFSLNAELVQMTDQEMKNYTGTAGFDPQVFFKNLTDNLNSFERNEMTMVDLHRIANETAGMFGLKLEGMTIDGVMYRDINKPQMYFNGNPTFNVIQIDKIDIPSIKLNIPNPDDYINGNASFGAITIEGFRAEISGNVTITVHP